MNAWFWYAIGAAILYGLHQVFTKLASKSISDGLGGFIVEATAALTILVYLAVLYFSGHWNQKVKEPGVVFGCHGDLCGRWNHLLLSAIPEGRTSFGGADGFGRWRSDYGCRGHSVF